MSLYSTSDIEAAAIAAIESQQAETATASH
jgi:hypothetical protein